MSIMNQRDAYGGVAIFFHWLLFLLIAGLVASGKYSASLSQQDKILDMISNHKQIGVAVFALMSLRLLWRLINPGVASLSEIKFLRMLAFIMHWALYVVILLQALSGILSSQLFGYDVTFLGYKVPTLIGANGLLANNIAVLPFIETPIHSKEAAKIIFNWHHIGGNVIIGLVAGHFLAAIFHALKGDETLRRMWFGYKPYYAKESHRNRVNL